VNVECVYKRDTKYVKCLSLLFIRTSTWFACKFENFERHRTQLAYKMSLAEIFFHSVFSQQQKLWSFLVYLRQEKRDERQREELYDEKKNLYITHDKTRML
jgi:hypothetical protein